MTAVFKHENPSLAVNTIYTDKLLNCSTDVSFSQIYFSPYKVMKKMSSINLLIGRPNNMKRKNNISYKINEGINLKVKNRQRDWRFWRFLVFRNGWYLGTYGKISGQAQFSISRKITFFWGIRHSPRKQKVKWKYTFTLSFSIELSFFFYLITVFFQ